MGMKLQTPCVGVCSMPDVADLAGNVRALIEQTVYGGETRVEPNGTIEPPPSKTSVCKRGLGPIE